jgi:tetratricopeptide (TPR) repeat protein
MAARRSRSPLALTLAWALALALQGGCSPDSIVGDGELPPKAEDPKDTQTELGALRAYRAAVIASRNSAAGPSGSMAVVSGDLADEMESRQTLFIGGIELTDRRILPAYTDPDAESRIVNTYQNYIELFTRLQETRSRAQVAGWLLRNFAPSASPALGAHLQAIEGYADIYLADMFCSGIPLSSVDPDGYTLQPGSSTAEVYQKAITLFDSALVGAADSIRFVHYASIGKARALLDLGQYAEAAAAVAGVPDGYEYVLAFDSRITGTNGSSEKAGANFMALLTQSFGSPGFYSTSPPGMSDLEGGNGLDWMSSGDPRTDAVTYGNDYDNHPLYVPARLDPEGGSPIAIADWREARLIEAEAALQGGDVTTWLAKLNGLREGQVFPPAPGDTTGTARTLPPLADPGSFDGRVDLLFRERGFWFHLTGRRQGDLRRLIRQYGRDPSTVYPNGRHPSGAAYGSDVNAPVPASELRYNRLYTGCQNRGA